MKKQHKATDNTDNTKNRNSKTATHVWLTDGQKTLKEDEKNKSNETETQK